jgi:hypothetical protein
VLLYADFDEGGQPSADTRSILERSLTVLDRAYEWGHEDLLHSIATRRRTSSGLYRPLPENVALPKPRALSPFVPPAFDTPGRSGSPRERPCRCRARIRAGPSRRA